jgi:hypothetical protein
MLLNGEVMTRRKRGKILLASWEVESIPRLSSHKIRLPATLLYYGAQLFHIFAVEDELAGFRQLAVPYDPRNFSFRIKNRDSVVVEHRQGF